MFRVPGRYPRSALVRFQSRAAHLNPLQSRKATAKLALATGAAINTYNGTHIGTEASYVIDDNSQILPYSALQIVLMTVPPANQPYLIGVAITIGMTAVEVATATTAAVNAWVTTYRGQFPDLSSMVARQRMAGDVLLPYVDVELPWGVLGVPPVVVAGPASMGIFDGIGGVDNPLLPGIVGPRLHLLPARQRYTDNYYGDIQIG